MKRHGNLFEKIVDRGNIELAYEIAKKGKSERPGVQATERDREARLEALRQSLIDGTFTTSPYHVKTIYEPKARQIYILPFFPDRIVQHAVMNIVVPIWDAMMIKDSYACRHGKGQHAGSLRCMQFVRRNKYVCQFDVSRFYPSVNHKKLMEIISRKIKDERVLWLFQDIIDSLGNESNVPIGNFTSQWFGNLYLNELDQLVKHQYHIRDYIRYCDDFLVFDNDKVHLRKIADEIEAYVGYVLHMKLSKKSLYPTSHGVDFLGYRHFPDGKILVRKSTAKRVKRRLKALPWELKHGRMTKEQALGKLASAHGWLKHAHAHNLRISIKLDELKKEVEAME